MTVIAYFGPQGTFTEQAANALAAEGFGGFGGFGGTGGTGGTEGTEGAELRPMPTIPATLAAVRDGAADTACVPVESSVEGAVPATMDALADGTALVTVAETVLPIRFAVLTRPDTATVRTVASYPVALAQVRGWLAEHLPAAETVATSSTAAAAVAVQEGTYDAAVTAEVAAAHYPLKVFATDVADVRDALTRFLLLRRPCPPPPPTGADRTSVIVTADDRAGSLSELLVELAVREVNLTRLEARPTRARLGEYRFYLDFDGHITQPRIGEALAALYRRGSSVRFLGSYPKATAPKATAPKATAPKATGPKATVPKATVPKGTPPNGNPANASIESAFDNAAAWLAAVREGRTG